MKKLNIIIIFFLGFNSLAFSGSGDTLYVKNDVNLVLSNPGTKGKFYVAGKLSLLDDHVSFQIYSDSSFLAKRENKNFRYNYLIKSFDIPYAEIKNMNRGMFVVNIIFIVVSKLEFELDNKVKYQFDMRKDRKRVMEIIEQHSTAIGNKAQIKSEMRGENRH